MKKRPLTIILIAFFHILIAPSIMVLYNFYTLGINPLAQLQILIENHHFTYLWSLICSPLVGIVILMYKSWSLSLFWFIKIVVLIGNFKHMSKLFESEMYYHVAFALIITILNVAIVTYFLVPVVFRSFSDYSLHWWKHKKRFLMRVPVSIKHGENNFEGQIVNISESGVFVSSLKELNQALSIVLYFVYENLVFELKAQIIYLGPEKKSCGAQFIEISKEDSKKLMKLTEILKKKGLLTSRDEMSRLQELRFCLRRLFKGDYKALFPNY